MTLPKTSTSYPVEMITAIERAHETGEVVIPTLSPLAMRLQFQGLRGAMRKEGKGEFVDMVSFHVTDKEFIIRLRAAHPMVTDIAAALNIPIIPSSGKSALDDAEAAIDRILGNTPNGLQ